MFLLLSALALAVPDLPAEGGRTYAAPGGNVTLSDEEIARRIIAAPQEEHMVWQEGWPQWRRWWEVPELTRAVLAVAEATPLWASPDGKEKVSSTAGEVAARIKSGQPGGLAWKEGMSAWAKAEQIPEVALLVSWPRLPGTASAGGVGGPPPLPGSGRPPARPTAEAAPDPAPARPAPPAPPDTAPPDAAPPDTAPAAPRLDPAPMTPRPAQAAPAGIGAAVDGEVDLIATAATGGLFQGAIPAARLSARADLSARVWAMAEVEASLMPEGRDPLLALPSAAVVPEVADGYPEQRAEGWQAGPRQIVAGAALGERQELRAGLQYSPFGVTAEYEYAWALGGPDRLDLASAAGLVPQTDMAAVWALQGDRAEIEAGAAAGTGGLEDNDGKALSARGRFAAGPAQIGLSARADWSGTADVGDEARTVLGQADVAVEAGRFRALVIGLAGQTVDVESGDSYPLLGGQANVGLTVPARGAVRAVDIRGLAMYWVGPLETEVWPDNWMSEGASLTLEWATEERPDPLLLRTGLIYQAFVPENIEEEVEHTASASVQLRF